MITITEGLSEINLIKKKLATKRANIHQITIRATHVPDVYEKEGGSRAHIDREMQSISDLYHRLIRIRSQISAANLVHVISITEEDLTISQSIHDWLIWKREIVKDEIGFFNNANHAIKMHLDTISKQPQVHKDEQGTIHLVKHEINVDYPKWIRYQANLNSILEKLDGQLSLKNAIIEIPG